MIPHHHCLCVNVHNRQCSALKAQSKNREGQRGDAKAAGCLMRVVALLL